METTGAPASSFISPMTISEDAELEIDTPSAMSAAFKTPEVDENKKYKTNHFDCNFWTYNIYFLLRYTWRVDLAKSEKFWSGWFKDLSAKFLDIRVPKLLLLASIDGLDRTLTVGQMQGKFQMQVLARCGHVVHEDRPHEVAEVIASYMVRNKFAEPTGDFHRQLPTC